MQPWCRRVGSLGPLCAVAVVGCGGGASKKSSAPVVAVGETTAEQETPKSENAAKAAALFAEFSEKVDTVEKGKAVDKQWVEQQLRAVVALDPEHSAARFGLAVLDEADGRSDQAKSVYEDILAEDPTFAPAQENLARFVAEGGDLDKAEEIYRKIVAADPTNTTSRLALARIVYQGKKHREAIKLCRQALQRKADAIEAFRVLALSYIALGNRSMAELIIGRGLKVDDKDRELQYALARILLARDDVAEGVAKLKEIIAIDPEWARPRSELAQIALNYQDFGNASRHYERLAKDHPSDRGVQMNLAITYKGLGRFDKAEEIYQALLKADDSDADVHWNLGVLYHRHLARFDDAIAMYSKAKTKNGDLTRKVDRLVKRIAKEKKNLAAAEARAEKEKQREEALQAVCAASSEGKSSGSEILGKIGGEQERMGLAFGLLEEAFAGLQQGTKVQAQSRVSCAFALVAPDSPSGKTNSAILRLEWTKVLYQLGDSQAALKTIREALRLDPENPEAKLIEQQLLEIIEKDGGGKGA